MYQANADGQNGRTSESRRGYSRARIIEWLLGAVSAAIVAGVIGFLLYEAISPSGKAPDLVVTVDTIERKSDAYYVKFRALNRGEATAAGVTVEGRLMAGERSIETSEVTLDYVPAQSESQGALLFRKRPSDYRLLLQARGYTKP